MFATKTKIIIALVCFLLILSPFNQLMAASFYFSGNKTAKPAETVTYGIYVSSTDQAINAVSSTIKFDSTFLEVTGINKGGSIISFWATEPSFSNAGGTINFDGIIMNPGYTGGGGKILTVSLRTKKAGSTNLTFSGSQILANDGEGTSVFTGAGTATLSIVEETASPEEKPITEETVPIISAPNIFSDTHSNKDAWYNNNSPIIKIQPNNQANAIRFGLNQTTGQQPTVIYTPPIWERALDPLPDGQYFFSAQMRNEKGWGNIAEFPFNIDTTAPQITEISFDEQSASTNLLKIKITASDELSGIAKYEVSLNNQAPITLLPDQAINDFLEITNIPKGEVQVKIIAFDQAGNTNEKTTSVFIKVSAPEITDYFETIFDGEKNTIIGQSLPNTNITFWLNKIGEEPTPQIIKTDEHGIFMFETKKLSIGNYEAFAQLLLPESTETIYGNKITFDVIEKPPIFTKENILFYGAAILSIINLILLVILIILIARKRKSNKKTDNQSIESLTQNLIEAYLQKILLIKANNKGKALSVNDKNTIKQIRNQIKSLSKMQK